MQSPFYKAVPGYFILWVHQDVFCLHLFIYIHLGLNLLIPTVAVAVIKTPYLKFTHLIIPSLRIPK